MLVITINKIPTPTDIAAKMSKRYFVSSAYVPKIVKWRRRDIVEPIVAATKWPPKTRLGVAATLCGMTNTVKVEEAMPTTIAALKSESPMMSIKINDKVASPH